MHGPEARRWQSALRDRIHPGASRDSQGVFQMLKKVSKKSLLLLGAVLALCAFAMPSMASASSWIGSGDIHSGNVGFQSFGAIPLTWACNAVTFGTLRHSASVLTITTASFSRCHGSGGAATGCTITYTGTRFPWTATAVSTSNIQIHGVHIDVRFETTPPAGSTACALNGNEVTLTGTLGLGIGLQTTWTPGSRTVDFTATTGLTGHAPGVALNTLVNGSAVATGTLNIAM
jgi:hypothetical protein